MNGEIPDSVVTGRRVAMILLVLAILLTVAGTVGLIWLWYTEPVTV